MTTKEPKPSKDTTSLEEPYDQILEDLTPYVIAAEENLEGLEIDAGKVDYPTGNLSIETINTYSDQTGPFSDMLIELDAAAYEEDITMDDWVLQDAALEPTAVVGFGKPKEDVSDQLLDTLETPKDYSEDDIVPLTEFAGTFKTDGSLVPHTFGVVDKQQGLGTATAILAAEIFPTDTWYAISQYDNVSPKVYSKLGDMELLEANVPGHSLPDKSYKFKLDLDSDLAGALESTDSGDHDILVGPDDEETIEALQDDIETTTYTIPEPGAVIEDGTTKLALKEVEQW